MRRTALATGMFALLVATAHAQSAGRPAYSVSDEWTVTNGAVSRVVKAEGGIVLIQQPGNPA